MDKQRSRFRNYLRSYKREIKKKILIDKLILFGSRVKGSYSRWSDFDLIVVSRNFRGIPWEKRQNKLSPLWDYKKYEGGADFLCYTPEEFEKMRDKICIVRRAVKEGIEIQAPVLFFMTNNFMRIARRCNCGRKPWEAVVEILIKPEGEVNHFKLIEKIPKDYVDGL